MRKDVWVAINTVQCFEGCDEEQVNLMTRAKLYSRKGKFYIAYEESELTGLEGTKTTIKMDGNEVLLIRTGSYPAHMLFIENQKHVGLYQTLFGSMTISTHASRVHNTISEDGGRLDIDYTIEVDNALTGRHSMEIVVTPSEGQMVN